MKMLKLLLVLTTLCGVVYPLAITLVGQTLFHHEANGSLIVSDEKIVGSKLLAQKFSRDDYFHPRPSASDYATVASGASQFSPTHKAGIELREKRRSEFPQAGVDAWTASGSGLDPHISPETAYAQVNRVAAARKVTIESLKSLIDTHTEGATWGIWGRPRVNVLELNLSLLMTEGQNANSR